MQKHGSLVIGNLLCRNFFFCKQHYLKLEACITTASIIIMGVGQVHYGVSLEHCCTAYFQIISRHGQREECEFLKQQHNPTVSSHMFRGRQAFLLYDVRERERDVLIEKLFLLNSWQIANLKKITSSLGLAIKKDIVIAISCHYA